MKASNQCCTKWSVSQPEMEWRHACFCWLALQPGRKKIVVRFNKISIQSRSLRIHKHGTLRLRPSAIPNQQHTNTLRLHASLCDALLVTDTQNERDGSYQSGRSPNTAALRYEACCVFYRSKFRIVGSKLTWSMHTIVFVLSWGGGSLVIGRSAVQGSYQISTIRFNKAGNVRMT